MVVAMVSRGESYSLVADDVPQVAASALVCDLVLYLLELGNEHFGKVGGAADQARVGPSQEPQ